MGTGLNPPDITPAVPLLSATDGDDGGVFPTGFSWSCLREGPDQAGSATAGPS